MTGSVVSPWEAQPERAALADRALFPSDGKIVDELAGPTPAGVSGRMKNFEPVGRWG